MQKPFASLITRCSRSPLYAKAALSITNFCRTYDKSSSPPTDAQLGKANLLPAGEVEFIGTSHGVVQECAPLRQVGFRNQIFSAASKNSMHCKLFFIKVLH